MCAALRAILLTTQGILPLRNKVKFAFLYKMWSELFSDVRDETN